MDLEHGWYLRARAVVRRNIKRLHHTTWRSGVSNVAHNRAPARSVSVGKDIGLRRHNYHQTTNHGAVVVDDDGIGARGQTNRHNKTDCRWTNRIKPTSCRSYR